jgi:hypothetical protein
LPADQREALVVRVGGGTDPKIRPECVHDLLTVQTVARSQGEELYEVGRLPQAPITLLDGSSPHHDLEATQQPDAYGLEPFGSPFRVHSHLGLRSVTFVGPAKDNNNKDGNARDSLLRRTMLFVWYSIARVNQ